MSNVAARVLVAVLLRARRELLDEALAGGGRKALREFVTSPVGHEDFGNRADDGAAALLWRPSRRREP
ncbi:MAG TPA: hypothetical protein VMY78_15650 [Solirubrobacteraceae bacterium]|nr:hypothetical protein [Solirubrobacteraceae bacterium]